MDTRRVTRSLEAPTGDQFHSVMELSLVYLTCPRDLLCVGLASKDLRPYVWTYLNIWEILPQYMGDNVAKGAR